jgi:hypothetical protein
VLSKLSLTLQPTTVVRFLSEKKRNKMESEGLGMAELKTMIARYRAMIEGSLLALRLVQDIIDKLESAVEGRQAGNRGDKQAGRE